MSTLDTLASIQGLARTIQSETGYYTTYVESMHGSGTITAEVWIQIGFKEFDHYKGTTDPFMECEVSLEVARDRVADWLVRYRKEVEEEA